MKIEREGNITINEENGKQIPYISLKSFHFTNFITLPPPPPHPPPPPPFSSY